MSSATVQAQEINRAGIAYFLTTDSATSISAQQYPSDIVADAVTTDILKAAASETGSMTITGTTQSTDKDTGCLVVEGGVGIEKNLNVGGDMDIDGTLTVNTVNRTSADLILQTTTSGNLVLAPAGDVTTGKLVRITDITQSTDKDTGCLVVEGGVGIEKNLNVGGDVNIVGTLTPGALTLPTVINVNTVNRTSGDLTLQTTTSGNLVLTPAGTTTTSKAITITDTTPSTTASTGALVVSGGLGAGGQISSASLIAGSNLSASTTASSSYAVRGICTNGSFTGNVGILATNRSSSTAFNFLNAFADWNGTGGTSLFSVRGDGRVTCNEVVTPSVSTASGDLTIAPAANVTTAQPLRVTNNTPSSSTSTGCAVFSGGVGVAGDVRCGNLNTFTGTMTQLNISSGVTIFGNGITQCNRIDAPAGNFLQLTNGAGSAQLWIGGNDIYPDVDNATGLGTGSKRWSAVWAFNGTIQTSAGVLKNHTPLNSGLEELQQIDTVEFEWKNDVSDDVEEEDEQGKKRKRKRRHLGLLAENIKTVFPDIVHGEGENMGVNYAELVPLLVNCIKQLNEKVTALEGQGFTAAAAQPAKRRKRSVPMEEISANFWTAGAEPS
jgi:enhancing lycopene biosynthesis protein 2